MACKLVTYIDGDEETPLRVLRENHSVAASVSIKTKDEEAVLSFLKSALWDDTNEMPVPATKGAEKVPYTTHRDHLYDMVQDAVEDVAVGVRDHPLGPYLDELVALCKCESAMETVYLIRGAA